VLLILEKIKQKQEIFLVSGKMDNPNCTKYNPKYDYIWKRCLTGPTWDKSERRNYSAKDNKFISPDFYLSHTELNVKGKNMKVEKLRLAFLKKKKKKISRGNIIKYKHLISKRLFREINWIEYMEIKKLLFLSPYLIIN